MGDCDRTCVYFVFVLLNIFTQYQDYRERGGGACDYRVSYTRARGSSLDRDRLDHKEGNIGAHDSDDAVPSHSLILLRTQAHDQLCYIA